MVPDRALGPILTSWASPGNEPWQRSSEVKSLSKVSDGLDLQPYPWLGEPARILRRVSCAGTKREGHGAGCLCQFCL